MSAAASSRRRADLLGGAALVLVTLLLYLATLSRSPSGDSVEAARAVNSAAAIDRIDAYHLILQPLCRIWVDVWRWCGWSGATITALQVANALGGAVSVGIVFLIVVQLTRSRPAAALAASGLAVSGGMWMFATEAEGVVLPLPVHLALLLVLLRLSPGEPSEPARAFGLGVVLGVASLTYLTFAALIALALLVYAQGRGRSAAPVWMLAGVAAVAAPAASFLAHVHTNDIWRWDALPLVYGGRGSYGVVRWENVPRGIYALLRTLVLYPGLGINDRTSRFLARADSSQRAMLIGTYLVVAAAAARPLLLAWRERRTWSLVLRQRLALWAALYAAFAFYWVPSDLEFWIPVTVAWFVLVGLLIANGSIPRRLAIAGVVAMLLANGANVILPHHFSG